DMWPRVRASSVAAYNFTSGNYATTAFEFLQGSNPAYNQNINKSTITGPDNGNFDPSDPSNPDKKEGYGRDFKGYSMGPGYYGKTFYMWPPDPRFDPLAVTNAPDTKNPAQDTSGRWMADWRKRFFYNGGTTTPLDGDNSRLWNTATKQWAQSSNSN